MNLKEGKRKKLILILFCIFSFLAGAINGFLGTGGGIIFIFMLSFLTKNRAKDNYATSICAVLFISLIGLISYFKNSNIDFNIISEVGLPAVVGGVVGALLVDKMQTKWLNIIFAGLIIYSGISMLFK
ncbi:MAG: sulfite exporter TauE/SafE family protein [Clostridia bacterium]|nr:sulfite exporter TauE/SafE family protein [Clostridia bacterium]